MPLVNVDLASINDLDGGRVALAFTNELRRAVADCMDRPGDANARTISLELKLTPVVDDDGSCDGANGEFKIKSKVPDRKSRTYSFGVNKAGHLIYSSTSPDNVNQTTFDDVDPETGRASR